MATLRKAAQAFAGSIRFNFALSPIEAERLFRFLWQEMTVGIHAPILQHAIDVVAEAFEIEEKT